MRKLLAPAIVLAAAAIGPTTPVASASPLPPPLPAPGRFATRVDNPWFPLTPGSVYVYRGMSDGKPARDVLRVTRRTRTIEGIRATVIDDRVYLGRRLEERTTDWYAQDTDGNVWYLGERTATLDANGNVKSTEGTWRTGVDGARAGIYMPAHPRPGQSGLQEFYPGQAEDFFKVLDTSVPAHTLLGFTPHALLTQETTPLEPGVLDHKLYAQGIGTVREETIKGGRERFVLVAFHRPGRR